MSEACCVPVQRNRPPCPGCGTRAVVVDEQTVKALLTTTALRRFLPEPLYFCGSPKCDVVYFDGGQAFGTADLRVPVWQKLPAGDRLICYCFGENETDMRREIGETGLSAAVSRVRAGIAAKRCACELRNPRGTCCLGDVSTIVKELLGSAHAAVP